MLRKKTVSTLFILLVLILQACSSEEDGSGIAFTTPVESQPTPTNTPSATVIPSPTTAPTITPVLAGFAVPRPTEPISAANVSQVTALAVWVSSDRIVTVAMSPSLEYVAAGSETGVITIWRAENGEPVFTFEHRDAEDNYWVGELQLGFTHDGKYLISLDAGFLRQWSLEGGEQIRQFRLVPEDSNASPLTSYTATLMDTDEELLIVLNKTKSEGIRYCANTSWRIEVEDTLMWWLATDFSAIKILSCLTADAPTVLVSPDQSFMLSSFSEGEKPCAVHSCPRSGPTETPFAGISSIYMWNDNGTLLSEHQYPGYLYGRWSAISPDGKDLAIATEGFIDVLDLETWERVQRVSTPGESPEGDGFYSFYLPVFSADSTLLFTGLGKDVHVWELSSGQLLANLSGHLRDVTDIDISDDGTLLVSVSKDGTIRLWGIP